MAAVTFVGPTRQSLGVVADLSTLFDPDYTLREVTRDPSDYYLRRGEAPGRWLGEGTARLGLSDEVGPQELHDLFAGKDPRTGRYLIPARGSSLRAGRRVEETGVDVKAAAARLGISEDGVRKKLQQGELAGEKTPKGHWRIPASAIDAYAAGHRPAVPEKPLASPGDDGRYGVEDGARMAGVNRSYLTRILREGPPEVTTRDDGRPVQYAVGERDERGRWRIDPAELRRFTESRRPPRAVPAYDLVLRAPKSDSPLRLAVGEPVGRRSSPHGGLRRRARIVTQLRVRRCSGADRRGRCRAVGAPQIAEYRAPTRPRVRWASWWHRRRSPQVQHAVRRGSDEAPRFEPAAEVSCPTPSVWLTATAPTL